MNYNLALVAFFYSNIAALSDHFCQMGLPLSKQASVGPPIQYQTKRLLSLKSGFEVFKQSRQPLLNPNIEHRKQESPLANYTQTTTIRWQRTSIDSFVDRLPTHPKEALTHTHQLRESSSGRPSALDPPKDRNIETNSYGTDKVNKKLQNTLSILILFLINKSK